MSQKITLRFSDIFSQMVSSNLTSLLHVLIYAKVQDIIQLSATYFDEVCHIERDHPVHIICSKCPPSAKTHAEWSHLIWHNFVTVEDN